MEQYTALHDSYQDKVEQVITMQKVDGGCEDSTDTSG